MFRSPHNSGQRCPHTPCSSWRSQRGWVPVGAGLCGPGARGCGAVRARGRAPYLAPGWLSLTPAAPGLPVAVYGAAAPGAAADLS